MAVAAAVTAAPEREDREDDREGLEARDLTRRWGRRILEIDIMILVAFSGFYWLLAGISRNVWESVRVSGNV